jgi:hypothetical protein
MSYTLLFYSFPAGKLQNRTIVLPFNGIVFLVIHH